MCECPSAAIRSVEVTTPIGAERHRQGTRYGRIVVELQDLGELNRRVRCAILEENRGIEPYAAGAWIDRPANKPIEPVYVGATAPVYGDRVVPTDRNLGIVGPTQYELNTLPLDPEVIVRNHRDAGIGFLTSVGVTETV